MLTHVFPVVKGISKEGEEAKKINGRGRGRKREKKDTSTEGTTLENALR